VKFLCPFLFTSSRLDSVVRTTGRQPVSNVAAWERIAVQSIPDFPWHTWRPVEHPVFMYIPGKPVFLVCLATVWTQFLFDEPKMLRRITRDVSMQNLGLLRRFFLVEQAVGQGSQVV